MDDRTRIRKAIEALDIFIKDLQLHNGAGLSENKNLLWNIFYENDRLHDVFKKYIPIEHLGGIEKSLYQFINDRASREDDHPKYQAFLTNIKQMITESHEVGNMRVFYSWQADLPESENKDFIQVAIQDALGELNNENNWNLYIDMDTRGESGSPDIVSTILRKIEDADIFIADVTAIQKLNSKELPNPNVLFELGYAMKALGEERVIMVVNSAKTNIKYLPFDLGLKRQLCYEHPSEKSDISSVKNDLKEQLKQKIREVIENT